MFAQMISDKRKKRCDNWLHAEMGTEIGRDRAGTMGKRKGGVVQGNESLLRSRGAAGGHQGDQVEQAGGEKFREKKCLNFPQFNYCHKLISRYCYVSTGKN